jgi:hypothetical protein
MRVKVEGYIEMSVENFNVIMSHNDPHTSLVYSIHMGYVDASELEFTPVEEKKKKV